ncbi:hypothetical protein HPB51_027948 [Rhipicephalus microplus]|uniref:Uncharacterized protein n=1 Tax=Rhipicephalus microplus TaxID=6941 RepID=A0A9J6CYI0_RHIMP|nr:hypothetical protein HPB51_027948 [Rhipicephalus microplus]
MSFSSIRCGASGGTAAPALVTPSAFAYRAGGCGTCPCSPEYSTYSQTETRDSRVLRSQGLASLGEVYHLACFACDACKRQLSTGEEFALHDGRVLCKSHYFRATRRGFRIQRRKQRTGVRVRKLWWWLRWRRRLQSQDKASAYNLYRRAAKVLQANFNLDSNPDGQDLERIAQITGLSKRVTQVWFQNSRARQKKYFNNQAKKVNTVSGGAVSAGPACSGCGMLYCLCAHQGLPMGQVT